MKLHKNLFNENKAIYKIFFFRRYNACNDIQRLCLTFMHIAALKKLTRSTPRY